MYLSLGTARLLAIPFPYITQQPIYKAGDEVQKNLYLTLKTCFNLLCGEYFSPREWERVKSRREMNPAFLR